MAGKDNHRNSGSRRVNMKIWGGVPSFNRNLSRHQLSCLLVYTTAIESVTCLQEEEEEKHGQNGKNIFGYVIRYSVYRLYVCVVHCHVCLCCPLSCSAYSHRLQNLTDLILCYILECSGLVWIMQSSLYTCLLDI